VEVSKRDAKKGTTTPRKDIQDGAKWILPRISPTWRELCSFPPPMTKPTATVVESSDRDRSGDQPLRQGYSATGKFFMVPTHALSLRFRRSLFFSNRLMELTVAKVLPRWVCQVVKLETFWKRTASPRSPRFPCVLVPNDNTMIQNPSIQPVRFSADDRQDDHQCAERQRYHVRTMCSPSTSPTAAPHRRRHRPLRRHASDRPFGHVLNVVAASHA